jgi:predicted RNA binding protein YcfA (HicA-like mRNA interferase family)
MSKLPNVNSKKLLKVLLKLGFYIHHQSGSHINLRHNLKNHLHIVVPNHSKDLAPKTLKSIIVQTEISVDDFADLL